MMDEFNSETDSDYNSYWRDWVGSFYFPASSVKHMPLPRIKACLRVAAVVARALFRMCFLYYHDFL